MNYQEYMDNLNLTVKTAYGQCEYVCLNMIKIFPELKLVRGHYWDDELGKRQHWWLEDKSKAIIDPTVIQFPSNGFGEYEPWIEGTPEPTGKCPNCGEYCWNNENVHEECFDAYVASIGCDY